MTIRWSRRVVRRLAVAPLCLAFCLLALRPAAAEDKEPGKGEAAPRVPLKKVVLFTAGVGYFEHRGTVEGDASLDLRFNVNDINDLLKSLVLQDLGGGQVSTVTYGSRDPASKTLQTFSINLTDNPTLAQILGQIRGERVEIDAPQRLEGTVLGIEKRSRAAGDNKVIEIDVLNLLTSTGLRSVPLSEVGTIKLTNEKLDAELREALKVLAMSHSSDKKTVTLNFRGQGQRQVGVGYIQEMPLWKTSYRLVLKDGEAPYLQGWAIVENTTEEDWNDVALNLVSGRPISFRMDLYQPLYVKRPLVTPEVYASLMPQNYEQDVSNNLALAPAPPQSATFGALPAPPQADQKDFRAVPKSKAAMGRRGMGMGGMGGGGAVLNDRDYESEALGQVASVAEAGDVGELFEYRIETPVTLARQRSAMLPIVNATIKGEKVSIYNPSVLAKHPLNGLKLVNSTDLNLMQGPITVFDDAVYAGDAEIKDLAPKAERLISYAIDLDTEVVQTPSQNGQERLTSIKISKGVLHTTRKYVRGQIYTIKNSGGKAKNVLIESPIDPSWKLVTPKEPTEKTRDVYRFAVKVEPGKSEKSEVVEEMMQSQQVALTNLDTNAIVIYLDAKSVDEKVKQALREVVRRKQALSQLAAQRQRLQQQIGVIGEEQNRIRQNMAQLERNTDLYKSYIAKLTAQEDLNDNLRTQIDKLTADEEKGKTDLDHYILALEI